MGNLRMATLAAGILASALTLGAQDTRSSGELLSLEDIGRPLQGQQESVLDSLTDNARWAFDLSARGMYNNRANEWYSAFFMGLDLHKVFSGPDGDWGTLVLQPYVMRLDSPAQPAFFEDHHDWELVYRIFNFNYTGLAGGKFNVRVGHFEIPFGLEHVVNTNGTLHDYMHGPNIGIKADWGVSLNGELETFDYEFSLTRGTGNEWSSRDLLGTDRGSVAD